LRVTHRSFLYRPLLVLRLPRAPHPLGKRLRRNRALNPSIVVRLRSRRVALPRRITLNTLKILRRGCSRPTLKTIRTLGQIPHYNSHHRTSPVNDRQKITVSPEHTPPPQIHR
jgi:hypothetical protein